MKKLITSLSLFLALGYGTINIKNAEAYPAIEQCFDHQTKFSILAKTDQEQFDYYLVRISTQLDSYTNVIRVEKNGNCQTVVEQQQIFMYPLSNFLGKEVAHNLLTSKYLTLIEQYGGVEPLKYALLGELEADAPDIFFEDTVIVLKELGIDLAKETPNLIIVGEEGISGHPELQF